MNEEYKAKKMPGNNENQKNFDYVSCNGTLFRIFDGRRIWLENPPEDYQCIDGSSWISN